MRTYPTSPKAARIGTYIMGAMVLSMGVTLGISLMILKVPMVPTEDGDLKKKFEHGKVVRTYGAEPILQPLRDGTVKELRLKEEHVNQWIREGLRLPRFADNQDLQFKVAAQVPNVNIKDGQLQLVLPFKVLFMKKLRSFHYVVIGHFDREDGKYEFVSDEEWFGAAKLPFRALYSKRNILDFAQLFKNKQFFEDFKTSWEMLGGAMIEGDELVLWRS